jgi:phosphoribosylformylglycinamidine synthase
MHYSEAGLNEKEFNALVEALGREPNDCELLIMGVMWSEHCSYKSTKPLLRLFPTEGKSVVLGPGENAGIVDIGNGDGIAFKVESHNHPSAVAPYQGSATGVGGIIRDILALGARPVASMDGLFFGDPDLQKTRNLSDGIVRGIGGYGNPVGVPTVGGKTVYDPSYTDNPLVNAMCLGHVKLDEIISSQTAKPGQAVILLGSKTGRDGIAGAAFASVELSEDTKSSRPNIQIGDPFVEKLLIEACLELRDKGLIVSMQDMGAAGITSSSSEIAAKSGVGMIMHFDKVPLRETGMEPWEIALSESQERMLIIAEFDKVPPILEIAEKWDLDAAVIGEVIEGNDYIIKDGDQVIVDLPATLIGSDCPYPGWDAEEPSDLSERRSFAVENIPFEQDLGEELKKLLSSPNLRDKSWIYEQYDQMVQLNTVTGPGNNNVSILRIKGSDKLVAVSMEADPWKCYLDPYRGGAETVARSIRSLAVAGAETLGMTNCLNYPSPELPEQFWELSESVKGMADCCKELDCPVVSGNVSLYNETASGRILPTPLVGVVGLIDCEGSVLPCGHWEEGDHIFYVGLSNPSLSGSQYQLQKMGEPKGRPLAFNGKAEKDFTERALKTARENLARSGRTIAGGGLAVALAKESVSSGIGVEMKLNVPTRKDVFLFGEGGPRAIYAVPPHKVVEFLYTWRGYPLIMLAKAGGTSLSIQGHMDIEVSDLQNLWRNDQ